MKQFLFKVIFILSIVLVFNLALFFLSQKLYFNEYTQFSLDYDSYLLADSHGVAALSNLAEQYGIYNFSHGSDTYLDMYRKLTFLIDRKQIDTIYIVADEHALSPYRETTNNLDRSLYYSNPSEFDNYYEYFKANYIKKYLVIFQPKIGDFIQSFIYAKIKNKIVNGINKTETWAEMSIDNRMKMAEIRVLEQFPSNDRSIRLEQTLLEIISTCKQNNITLIGIKFPLPLEYITTLGNRTYNIGNIFKSNNITILDYTRAFIYNNEYFNDADHLNELGRHEFIKLLLEDIKTHMDISL
jgi:hypothetical protein